MTDNATHIIVDGTHHIADNTLLVDVVTSLKALIAGGRGDERVELHAQRGDELNGQQLEGPIYQVYPTVLDIARERTEKELAANQETLDWFAGTRDRAVGPDDAVNVAGLDKLGAQAVALRRELLAAGEFAPQLEKLDDQIARLASLVHEPLDQPASGAGKVRVFDERRLARDADEVRDLPLRDKILRVTKQRDEITAASGEDRDLRATAQEMNEEAKELIRQYTGKPILKAVEAILEEAFPGMIRAFYPKVYEHTGRYHSPRVMAVMIANVVAEMLRYGYHKSATAYRLMMPGLRYMQDHRMPMFFLAPDLLEAVLRTDFDDDINWHDGLELPYESGMLMLPKGALVHPKDGEVAMLMWARVRQGEHASPWLGIPMSVMPHDSFVMLGACPETLIWYDSILTSNVRPTMRLHNLFYREPGQPIPAVKRCNFMDSDLTELDSEFMEKMGVILFGTILAMNARPQLVERGKLIKRVGKSGEQAREFWSPNVIGAKYKFKREVPHVSDGQFVIAARAGGGTHASPRLHWRRGHYRNQPVGPARRERKTIWLEPCLIGAE